MRFFSFAILLTLNMTACKSMDMQSGLSGDSDQFPSPLVNWLMKISDNEYLGDFTYARPIPSVYKNRIMDGKWFYTKGNKLYIQNRGSGMEGSGDWRYFFNDDEGGEPYLFLVRLGVKDGKYYTKYARLAMRSKGYNYSKTMRTPLEDIPSDRDIKMVDPSEQETVDFEKRIKNEEFDVVDRRAARILLAIYQDKSQGRYFVLDRVEGGFKVHRLTVVSKDKKTILDQDEHVPAMMSLNGDLFFKYEDLSYTFPGVSQNAAEGWASSDGKKKDTLKRLITSESKDYEKLKWLKDLGFTEDQRNEFKAPTNWKSPFSDK